MVKLQRVQRERKTFTQEAVHEVDNRQPGAKKIRGIYQWVDKKYKARILNYGTRLLYDVVVPEPAAFLIESLKKAVQPESFQLTKPVEPQIFSELLGVEARLRQLWASIRPTWDRVITRPMQRATA